MFRKLSDHNTFPFKFVFLFFVSGAESTVLFTLPDEDVNWNTAKSRCEALAFREF